LRRRCRAPGNCGTPLVADRRRCGTATASSAARTTAPPQPTSRASGGIICAAQASCLAWAINNHSISDRPDWHPDRRAAVSQDRRSVQTPPGTGGFSGLIICSANLPDKIAVAADTQMDDGGRPPARGRDNCSAAESPIGKQAQGATPNRYQRLHDLRAL